MRFEEMIKEELVFIQKSFKSNEEVISFLSKQLQKEGFVKESFSNSVIERERKYPTGLYLGNVNVAIPHTDIKHVLKPGIAIITLKTPVKFGKMDDPEEEIPVHIVFLLSVLNPKGYVTFLSKLTRSFSNKSFIQALYLENSPSKVVGLLRNILKTKVKVGS